MRKPKRSHTDTFAHCHRRGTTHLTERFSDSAPTRTLDYASLNTAARDAVLFSAEFGIEELLARAHIQDVALLGAILFEWGSCEKDGLLAAIDIVCPGKPARKEDC